MQQLTIRNFVRWTLIFALTWVVPLAAHGAEPEGDDRSAVSPFFRPLAAGKANAPAFGGEFSIDGDQTIAILGGTNAVEVQKHGYLETLLALAYPEYRLRIRNMAWEADTVYRQQRPRHFFQPSPIPYPGDPDGRQPIAVDTIVLWMGQSESLEGLGRLDAFRKAYVGMLDKLSTYTPRIVLVTPAPFEEVEGVQLDIASRNETLAKYVEAIEALGQERNLPVVDLFRGLKEMTIQLNDEQDEESKTRNGMHLNWVGHFGAAGIFAEDLGLPGTSQHLLKEDREEAELVGKLRQQVLQRNELWFRYWRPTNWAFLYGNRSLQPSSRDHIDSKKRWFPKEVASILPLAEEVEQEIQREAQKISASRE